MLSFIVPVYNAQDYLRQCLDSILAQSYADIEIVLIDDGSTDRSPSICREYAAKDSRISVIRQRNAGPSVARNTGLDAAHGEYLAFVDADDMLHPLFAETLMDIIGDGDIACCMFLRARECAWPKHQNHKVLRLDPQKAIEIGLYQHLMINSACCKIYHRSIFENLRFTPGILYEDLDIFYRAFEMASTKIAISMQKLYFYRDNQSSIINTFTPQRLLVLAVTNRMDRYFQDEPRLLKAARDRKFAAHFNMFAITRGREEYALAHSQCWNLIKQYRFEVLFNPKTRLKNRLGAAISCAGKRFTEFVISFFYR